MYLACDLLGQEEILVEVSQTFGEKIYVDEAKNSECFNSLKLMVPEIISDDPFSRFQLFDGFPKLYERAEAKIAEARANFQHEPLIIRASSQWYACNEGVSEMEKQRKEKVDQAVKDIYGVWHVCYSIHSSREELDWALQLLGPKWVVSTTPNCRAMELDYVKKHCFKNKQAFNDSLCKLLDINAVESLVPDGLKKNPSCSHVVEDISNGYVEVQSGPVVMSTYQRKRLSLSPPSRRPMVTLFGRARLGLPCLTFLNESKDASAIFHSNEKAQTETENASFQKDNGTVMNTGEHLGTTKPSDFATAINTEEHLEATRPSDIATVINTEEHSETMRPSDFAVKNCSGPSSNDDKEMPTSFLMEKSKEAIVKVNAEELLRTKRKIDFAETNSTKLDATLTVSSSNNYSENLRRLYRSRNVPVPQYLPSLASLMASNKSARKRT